MITIDCPLCDGLAAVDAAMTAVACDSCGVTVEVASDLQVPALDVAA